MIVNDEQRRAMEFIAFANRGGYRPTGREVNEWRLRPEPRQRRRGKLLQAEVPAVPERRVRVGGSSQLDHLFEGVLSQFAGSKAAWLTGLDLGFSRTFQSASWASVLAGPGVKYEIIPGKPGKPAVYGPDKPPEKFLAHLRRLGWVERDARGGYGVTLLGHALLRSESSSEPGDGDSSVMVLAADDELAYGRVMGIIAECEDALIVDAYLGSDELVAILKLTSATRFLVSDKLKRSRLTELAVQIGSAPPSPSGATRELRKASLHDRWVVGDHKLYGLGSSINGVGKKSMTTLVEMPDEAARSIRAIVEDLWAQAETVSETRWAAGDSNEQHRSTGTSDEEHQSIHEEAGRFVHDGCKVRHKKRQAAENCTSGF